MLIAVGIGVFFSSQTDTPTSLSPEALKSIENFEAENNSEGDEVYDPALAEALSGISSQEDFGMSFEHVVPGEYSEVYVVRSGAPGEQMLVSLDGPGLLSDRDQIAIVDEVGVAHFTWKVNRYGVYQAHYDVTSSVDSTKEEQVTKSIEVK